MVRVMIIFPTLAICMGFSAGALIPKGTTGKALAVKSNPESVTNSNIAAMAHVSPSGLTSESVTVAHSHISDIVSVAKPQTSPPLDLFKPSKTEGEVSVRRAKRWVGAAQNWLRIKEGAIHADQAYLDSGKHHTILPWGNFRKLKLD